jgi:membrane protease subunit (stomatin/prohibitin family)
MNQFELFFPRVAATALPIALSQQATPSPLPQEDRDEPFQFEDVEVEARVTYAVRLADYSHPAADAVKVAEQRFRREIDRQLGADVVEALRAFQNASESSESDLSKSEIALAKRWAKAYDAARTAGFRDLGDTDEAFFDVRPI